MNFAAAMLYPLILLLPAAGVTDGEHSEGENGLEASVVPPSEEVGEAYAPQEQARPEFDPESHAALLAWPFTVSAFDGVEPESGWQMRIEQRVTIRVTPRASRQISRDMFAAVPDGEVGPRFSERKIGKCLSVGSIAGVQPDRDNRLLLFMRDRRVISAELERACRARDFYSGFYLTRNSDGQLCVDRDTLLSRSGMNCRLTRIRQLIEADH